MNNLDLFMTVRVSFTLAGLFTHARGIMFTLKYQFVQTKEFEQMFVKKLIDYYCCNHNKKKEEDDP